MKEASTLIEYLPDAFSSIPANHFIHRTKRFPIEAKTKKPAFAGWQAKATDDPAQLAAWAEAYPGCGWAIAYAESGLILVETDPKALKDLRDKNSERVGDERADAEFVKLLAMWGYPPDLKPHFRSRSGGKHCVFKAPASVNLIEPRTPGTKRPYRYTQGGIAWADGFAGACVETKINGYGLIPPSTFDGSPYTLWPESPFEPYPMLPALIAEIDRSLNTAIAPVSSSGTDEIKAGQYELRPLIKKILRVNHTVGMDYETWRNLIWALVAEYGTYVAEQIGFAIHDGASGTEDLLKSLIDGAARNYQPGNATISGFFKYASEHGDKDRVPLTTSAMFGGPSFLPDIDAILAEIDAKEAAIPVIAAPSIAPSGAMPMTGRGEAQAKAWTSILKAVPMVARNASHPEVPPEICHPLRNEINAAIPGIVEARNTEALAIVAAVHPDTAKNIAVLIPAVDHAAVAARASGIIEEVENDLKPADYGRDHKGEIQNDNIDNVAFFLSQLATEIRWNSWTETMEIRGWKWSDWTFVNDHVVTLLRGRASQTGTRFRVSKDFLWDSLLALSLRMKVDPVLDTLKALEQLWDGVLRLDTWLHCACSVPDDAYHRAVSQNVIGGMVKRARQPGCKHDEVLLLIGEQGTNKSTVPSIIGVQENWFTDEIELGDPSKELVLSLAGKLVVEIGEMGRKTVAGNNTVKSMLARRIDRGRTAYARTVTARPRRNIFVATTNDPEPLSDLTGNRRWLPVRIGAEINIDWLAANIGQIVGEAARRESKGESFRIPRDLWGVAALHQEAATETPEYQNILREWLAAKGLSVFMTIADLSHIAREAAGGRVVKSSEYNRVVEKMGFRRQTKRVDGKPTEVWLRGEAKDAYRLTAASLRTMPRGVNLSMVVDVPLSERLAVPPLPAFAKVLPPPPY